MLPGTVRPPVTVRDVRDDDGVANCNTLSKAEVVTTDRNVSAENQLHT